MTDNGNNIRNRGRGAVPPPPPPPPPGAAAASPSLSQRSSPSSRSRGRLGQKEASAYGRTLHLTDDEVDAVIENFMHVDDDRKKTMSRLLVEKYLSNWTWYNPQRNKTHGPSLTKAYAYYEHITLPRHFTGGAGGADHVLRRAEPGETEPTELYNFLTTPSSALIEWGIGVDLYFSSLRLMAIAVLIAGIINIPNIMFYASTEYSPDPQELSYSNSTSTSSLLSFSLTGSALCTTPKWAACPTCSPDDFDFEERFRVGVANDGTVLVLRNGCNGGSLQQGGLNMLTLIFLSVYTGLMALYLRHRAVRFDEDKITSTDYSVLVKNPPPDAFDPDDWKNFFEQFATKQVTAVTVALNNDALLRKLIDRRRHKDNLRRMLPRGTDMENEDIVRTAVARLIQELEAEPKGCIYNCIEKCIFPMLSWLYGNLLPVNVICDRIYALEEEIKELQKQKYKVAKVFVTFETEEDQRNALAALTVGRIDARMNNTGKIPASAVFRGEVLKVGEPTESNAVRWMDLGASPARRIIPRVINLILTVGIIALCGFIVARTRANPKLGPSAAGPLVTIFNSTVPVLLKILMIFEKHATEGEFQASLYQKITFFRWVNTAILFKLITPFTNTVTPGTSSIFPLLPSVNSLLWSELWLTPLLRLVDWMSNLKRHVLAPRAMTQDQMNLSFQGTFYNLGERYTDLTKILFLCFFYSALFPAAFFFAAAILLVQYYADKWCLLRIWGWTANIGPELSRFSVRYFFSGSLLAFAVVSAFSWAQFPYDNVCQLKNPRGGYAGNYTNVILDNGVVVPTVSVTEENEVAFCSQSWRDYPGFPFPPTSSVQPSDKYWMSDSQAKLTNLYGWFSVAYLVCFLVFLFGASSIQFFFSWFKGVYTPRGQDQKIDFSSNSEIFGYVPQIKLTNFPFPFLACDIDEVDQGLIGWNDPMKSYDEYNLIFDVPWPGLKRSKMTTGNTRTTGDHPLHMIEESSDVIPRQDAAAAASFETTNPIFSIIKHYPPEWLKQIYEDETNTPTATKSRAKTRSIDVEKYLKRSP